MTYTATQHQQRTDTGALRTVILFVATITTGLLAGIFVDWSNTIMPGLGDVDDRTFVATFRALDEAITNPLFLSALMGAPLLIALSIALHFRADQRPVLIWVGVAMIAYLVMLAVTFGANVPVNEDLKAAGHLQSSADFAAARAQFDETTWSAWNAVRAISSTIAFGCLAWALLIHRRVR
ncbi:anthrone oxygenase family protein [Solicola gregarius]|uniref:DUF1772 domain-containing protein n=1 Tax=Solicola gregarius TaxID=2908642 RepID=A0AA46TE12_9ACTN|nr:anthrone oxygenase family protein [Solicola gregarius]UYM03475.1 DUF1772 domain-containing protein [Solicola gregarius]